MNTVLIFVGVRGSGKSSVCARLESIGVHRIRPSTTRPPRGVDDSEYTFVPASKWEQGKWAWRLTVGTDSYGVSEDEIDKAKEHIVSCGVFDPRSLDELHKFAAKRPDVEFITVGLDTVSDAASQGQRVKTSNRQETDAAIVAQREIVEKCDAVLRGDEAVVGAAAIALAQVVAKRGVLHDGAIGSLLAAECLLTDADPASIQPASYDLRLSEHLWRGTIQTFPQSGVYSIPPYSYVIVQAQEEARLPKFVVARFDLKVSLFIHGIILSNGPQVDPGYRGALFCLLYNSSDREVPIRRGEHFATLEFASTARVTSGYKSQYQLKQKLTDFMAGDSVISPGSRLLDRIEETKKSVEDTKKAIEERMANHRNWILGSAAAAGALLLAIWAVAAPAVTSFRSEVETLKSETEVLRKELAAERSRLTEAREARDRGKPAEIPDAGTD